MLVVSYLVCIGLALLCGGYAEETKEGSLLVKHILHKRDTSHRYAPLPVTDESSDEPDPSTGGQGYNNPDTVRSQFSSRVNVAQSEGQSDYDRRRAQQEAERERQRLEQERRRRERMIEVERRNQEIAEANRRNQAIRESRRQSYASASSTGDDTASTGTQYTGTGQRQSYTGSSTGQRQGTYYTPTITTGTRTSSSSGQLPVYGYNGQQQGSSRSGVYTAGGQPSYGAYVPSGTYVQGRRYVSTGSGSSVPTGSGSYVPTGTGSYVPTRTGSYVPTGSGSYVPVASGSYVPSGGVSYVPTGSGYISSGGGSSSSGSYVPRGAYVPQQNIPRHIANPQYDGICPASGVRLRINGLGCNQAIAQFGSSICYRHEFTSRECCDTCQPMKKPTKPGCEYGDHSYQCRQIQSFDCYDRRQSGRCCESCERFLTGPPGCEYGDMVPRCQQVRENPSLCYIPDNARFCCSTCATIKDTTRPECPWGDYNTNLCTPYVNGGEVRINCYSSPIKRLCCQTCERIKSRYSGQYSVPGCEYGDRPVIFNTGFGSLNCTSFIRQFSMEQCQTNPAVAENCCFTCRRYQQG